MRTVIALTFVLTFACGHPTTNNTGGRVSGIDNDGCPEFYRGPPDTSNCSQNPPRGSCIEYCDPMCGTVTTCAFDPGFDCAAFATRTSDRIPCSGSGAPPPEDDAGIDIIDMDAGPLPDTTIAGN